MNDKELKKFLSQFREKIKPRKELTNKILADLNVTEEIENRYTLQEKKKGRFSGYEIIFNQIHDFMTKRRIIVPATIVVLVIIVWGIIQFGQRVPITGPETGPSAGEEQTGKQTGEQTAEYVEKEYVKTPPEVSLPQVTGDIDDTIDALTALSENEMVIIVEEGNDVSLIDFDSQAINDFGQSYDENEF